MENEYYGVLSTSRQFLSLLEVLKQRGLDLALPGAKGGAHAQRVELRHLEPPQRPQTNSCAKISSSTRPPKQST